MVEILSYRRNVCLPVLWKKLKWSWLKLNGHATQNSYKKIINSKILNWPKQAQISDSVLYKDPSTGLY